MSGKNKAVLDPRIKVRPKTWMGFAATYFVLVVLASGQVMIYAEFIPTNTLPPEFVLGMLGYWALVSAAFVLVVLLQKRRSFDKPMRQLGEAARQVARGDYSVYLEPRHLPAKADEVDVMFEDFNLMVEALASTDALKDAFIADTSHEIKTPLAVISNYASILRLDETSAEERRASAEAIIAATSNLSSLVSNILKLNKLENAGIVPEPEPFNVVRQLSGIALAFSQTIDDKGLDFDVILEDVALICADEGMLEIVWKNLLSNAVKFTPPGGSISLSQTTDEDAVTVCVGDSGCGMDDATLQRIFDKFYQGDPSHVHEGNGLGLALVWRIIELSGGSIHVRSEPGRGSTFSVSFKKAPNY